MFFTHQITENLTSQSRRTPSHLLNKSTRRAAEKKANLDIILRQLFNKARLFSLTNHIYASTTLIKKKEKEGKEKVEKKNQKMTSVAKARLHIKRIAIKSAVKCLEASFRCHFCGGTRTSMTNEQRKRQSRGRRSKEAGISDIKT